MDWGESVVAADPVGQLILEQAGIDLTGVHNIQEELGRARARYARIAVIDQAENRPASFDPEVRDALLQDSVPIVNATPHNLDDAYSLYREIAGLIDRSSRAESLVRRLHAPLVERAAQQLGRPRPCVAIVTNLSPLTLAGGHSFETDVIQLVGGESTTHSDEEWRTSLSLDDLKTREVDLIIVTDPVGQSTMTSSALSEFTNQVQPAHVQSSLFHAAAFWLDDPTPRRATLDQWEQWVEAVRNADLGRTNCALDPRDRPPRLP